MRQELSKDWFLISGERWAVFSPSMLPVFRERLTRSHIVERRSSIFSSRINAGKGSLVEVLILDSLMISVISLIEVGSKLLRSVPLKVSQEGSWLPASLGKEAWILSILSMKKLLKLLTAFWIVSTGGSVTLGSWSRKVLTKL